MLSFTNVVHLFPDEFTGLGRGRIAFTGVLSCSLQGFFFRHGFLIDVGRDLSRR
jgi:hypothetical protein